MIEISCSNDDLASTPSNRSEYFSVNSSLNILDSNDEIYHSFDEEIEPQITCESITVYNRRVQHNKIIKQDHLEIDLDENICILSMSIETIPETDTCRNSAECELWDKCSQPLRVVKSQESVNTFEEDLINSSIYSNSQIKESSISEDDNINNSSDNEESISINQLNTSQIEGELSDINDIIYDSSISPVNAVNPIISEENDSSQVDANMVDDIQNSNDNITLSEPLEIDNELQIYNMVKQLEQNARLEYEPITISLVNEQETTELADKDDGTMSTEECQIQVTTEEPPIQLKSTNTSENSKDPIDNIEDSPVKRSYLCCAAIRKNRKRTESPKSKPVQKSKAKRFFFFFKKPPTVEKKPDKEVVVEQITNNYKCHNSIFVNSIDYDGIPFIDADVTIDTEDYISLAKQELFSD